jgi:glycosyltransferase involved in cell wall biosynthesis
MKDYLPQKQYSLAIVCATLDAGGAARVITTLSNYLISCFNSIEIICWRETSVFYKIDKDVKITIIPIESNKKYTICQMLWFRKYVKNQSYDVVLSFLAPFNIITSLSLIRLKIPLIVAERNDPQYIPNSYWERMIRNFSYFFVDKVLVQTESNKKYFPLFIQNKCTVIFNPVFLELKLVGKALAVQKEKKIVSIARLVKQKNQMLLLDAFAEICHQRDDYKLIIYGEGNMRESLEKRIKELKLEQKVFLPGKIKDIHNQILNADLFILVSNYEGMPNALIEAMCLGLPCISTKVSGAVDLIKNHDNGILVNVNDKGELVNAIRELLNDKIKAKLIAERATLLYSHLSVDVIAKEWFSVILNTIEKYPYR